LGGEIGRIARYLEIEVPDEVISTIAQAVSFSSVKANTVMMGPMPAEFAHNTWKQGLDTFFFKGTNGRWKEVLTDAELLMYEQAKARVLTPECARWLEEGRAALGG
jgi:aryl sulfotransferase